MTMKILFWFLVGVLFYTYFGYAILLYIFLRIRRLFYRQPVKPQPAESEPDICLFVTAFNEKDFIDQKVRNSFELDYPKEKIQYVWVTDGSDDGTPEFLKKYDELEIYHLPARQGKIHAMNRGMKFVKAPIVIFSDTNTLLSKKSIREIVRKFSNPEVGCVAGEKRIVELEADTAAGSGEGIYWKFESWIKNMDGEFNSAVGAVGELFAIRTTLFEEVENDTLLDDFIISLRIARKGYKIAYAPNAYALESPSLNSREEIKRKIRIAAGGVQTILRLKDLLNPFRYGWLTWQYFSHKVIRWTISPVSFFLILPVNLAVVLSDYSGKNDRFYLFFLFLQIVFYFLAFSGWFFENRKIRQKFLFIPFYFVFINYASIRGILRYFKGKQSVNWEKSKRAS